MTTNKELLWKISANHPKNSLKQHGPTLNPEWSLKASGQPERREPCTLFMKRDALDYCFLISQYLGTCRWIIPTSKCAGPVILSILNSFQTVEAQASIERYIKTIHTEYWAWTIYSFDTRTAYFGAVISHLSRTYHWYRCNVLSLEGHTYTTMQCAGVCSVMLQSWKRRNALS